MHSDSAISFASHLLSFLRGRACPGWDWAGVMFPWLPAVLILFVTSAKPSAAQSIELAQELGTVTVTIDGKLFYAVSHGRSAESGVVANYRPR